GGPWRRTETSAASSRARRCCEIAGNDMRKGSARSLAARSPSLSVTKIARRTGCAIAWKTSLSWRGRMAAPFGVFGPELSEPLYELGLPAPGELCLEPIEEGMQSWQEPAGRLHRDAPVGHEHVRRLTVRRQLVPKD